MSGAPKGPMNGSIRRQGANTWQVRIYNRHAGRREYFTVRGDKAAAKRARAKRIGEIEKGSLPPPPGAGKVTIRDLTEEWLDRKRAQREAKTVQQYEWCAKHILDRGFGLGSRHVQKVTHDDVQRFVDALVARGLSPKSVKGIASALSQVFKLARRKDLIRFNPTESIERPTATANPVVPPTPAQIRAVIDAALERGEPDRAALIRLKAATGMRRGEIAGLQWEDLELDGDPPQVTVRRAIPDLRGDGNGGPPPRVPKLPKTDTGIRTIGIDDETVRVLREHHSRTTELAQRLGFDRLPVGAFIFWPYNEGPLVPYAPQSITKMFRTLAGDGGLRPHQLRHFSVTQLLAAGVPEVEVMGRHGHASASSMKPYRHYIRARDRMSTQAMRDVLDSEQ